jgi:hypothetical protein
MFLGTNFLDILAVTRIREAAGAVATIFCDASAGRMWGQQMGIVAHHSILSKKVLKHDSQSIGCVHLGLNHVTSSALSLPTCMLVGPTPQ